MSRFGPVTALGLILLAPFAPAQDNWPQFRGPSAGVAEGKGLPVEWSTTKNVAWKADVPGRAWSSPVVWGDKVFVTTVVSAGKTEEPRKGLYFGGERGTPPPDEHRWLVLCLDAKTGKAVWDATAHKGKPTSTVHIKNSYASETPCTDGERLYAYFGNVGLFCYDVNTGKELWSQKWGAFKTRYGWGTAASPVLHKDRVYVVNDNEEKSFLVALDKKTGKEVWRVERDEKSNWATPFVWENEKRTEIVTAGTNKVRSYDLDGNLLWEMGGMSSIAIPTPFARHGLLYVSSGYVLDRKARPVFAILPGAAGDVSLTADENSSKFVRWAQKLAGPYNPTPLVYGDYLYVLYDMGQFACYDARTGKEVYGQQRLGAAQFTASPWAYDGKLFCLSEDGDTFVIQAGPELKVLARNSFDEMCLATPAVAGGALFVRTMTKLYRIEESTKK